MDIDAMVVAQQEWVDKIEAQIASGEGGNKGGTLPAEILKGNIDAARGRIGRLTAQREEVVRRLDDAIIEEKGALKLLEQAVGDATTSSQPVKRRPVKASRSAANG
jgi:hypothetical protein